MSKYIQNNRFSPNENPRHSSRIKKGLRTRTDDFILLSGVKEKQRGDLIAQGYSPRYSGVDKGFYV